MADQDTIKPLSIEQQQAMVAELRLATAEIEPFRVYAEVDRAFGRITDVCSTIRQHLPSEKSVKAKAKNVVGGLAPIKPEAAD